MNVVVAPTPFNKTIKVPTSKSYANRLLILSSLYPEEFFLRDVNSCEDVAYLVQALKKIGIEIEHDGHNLRIKGCFPTCEFDLGQALDLDLGNGGTTVRFLLPFLSLGKRLYRLKLGEQIKKRPLESLIETLKKLGVLLYWQEDYLCLQGPIKELPQKMVVDATETSQFASSLALSFSRFKTTIEMSDKSSAFSYFSLTQNIIEKVKSGQRDFDLPADFSSLAYPLALAAVCGQVCIENCYERDTTQADSVLLDIFTQMNVSFSFHQNGLTCQQAPLLKAFEQDCQNCQDLVPVLAYLASFAQGESVLSGLHNLRHKEIDRIKGVTSILDLFSVPWRFDEQSFSLYISGGKSCAPFVQWKSLPDHRMIMMVYLFMRSLNGGEIFEADFVAKSFPTFFEVMHP